VVGPTTLDVAAPDGWHPHALAPQGWYMVFLIDTDDVSRPFDPLVTETL
jgi:hypothetical protein